MQWSCTPHARAPPCASGSPLTLATPPPTPSTPSFPTAGPAARRRCASQRPTPSWLGQSGTTRGLASLCASSVPRCSTRSGPVGWEAGAAPYTLHPAQLPRLPWPASSQRRRRPAPLCCSVSQVQRLLAAAHRLPVDYTIEQDLHARSAPADCWYSALTQRLRLEQEAACRRRQRRRPPGHAGAAARRHACPRERRVGAARAAEMAAARAPPNERLSRFTQRSHTPAAAPQPLQECINTQSIITVPSLQLRYATAPSPPRNVIHCTARARGRNTPLRARAYKPPTYPQRPPNLSIWSTGPNLPPLSINRVQPTLVHPERSCARAVAAGARLSALGPFPLPTVGSYPVDPASSHACLPASCHPSTCF